jgi:hypothetical protein
VDPQRRHVISLYDAARIGLMPWRTRGFECFAYEHTERPSSVPRQMHGVTVYRVNLGDAATRAAIARRHDGLVAYAYAAPPSRDLSRVGVRWWPRKRLANPSFQDVALEEVHNVRMLLEGFAAPWIIIYSAASLLSVLWRPPDAIFQPFEFGGYLGDENHPEFPGITPRRDAYTQRQGVWLGGGMQMPRRHGVEPIYAHVKRAGRMTRTSPMNLWRAKVARKSLPRGFATAVCECMLGGTVREEGEI